MPRKLRNRIVNDDNDSGKKNVSQPQPQQVRRQQVTVEQLVAELKKTTERLREKLLLSFLEDTWEEINDEFVSSTPKAKFNHLSSEEQIQFLEEEKNQLRKRDELLIKYNEEILTKQVANLREQLRNGQLELEELRRRYGNEHNNYYNNV